VSRKPSTHHYFEELVNTTWEGMGRREEEERGRGEEAQYSGGEYSQLVEKTKAGQCRVWWLELLRYPIT
jgi:hypothetical protein